MASAKEEEVKRLIKVGIIHRTMESYPTTFLQANGVQPSSKEKKAYQRFLETSLDIDRQVDDAWGAVKKTIELEEQTPLWANVVGPVLLLGFGISVGATVFLERLRLLLPAAIILSLFFGLAITFYGQTRNFFKAHKVASGLVGGLVVLVAVLTTVVLAPYSNPQQPGLTPEAKSK